MPQQQSASSSVWGPDREPTAIEVATATLSQQAALADRPVSVDRPPMPVIFEDRVEVGDSMLGAGILPGMTERTVGEVFHHPPNTPPRILRDEGLGNRGMSMNDQDFERNVGLDPTRYAVGQEVDDEMQAAVARYVQAVNPMLAVGQVADQEYNIVPDPITTVTRKDYDQDFGLSTQAELRATGFGSLRGGPATVEEVIDTVGDAPRAPVSRGSLEQFSNDLADAGMGIDDIRSFVGSVSRYEADEVEPMLLLAQGRPAAEQYMSDVLPSGVPLAVVPENVEDENLVPSAYVQRILDAGVEQLYDIENPPEYHPAESDYHDMTGQTGYDDGVLQSLGRLRPRRTAFGFAGAASVPTTAAAGPTYATMGSGQNVAGPTGTVASTPQADAAVTAQAQYTGQVATVTDAAVRDMGILYANVVNYREGQLRYDYAMASLGALNGIALQAGSAISALAQQYSSSVSQAVLVSVAQQASAKLSAAANEINTKLNQIAAFNTPAVSASAFTATQAGAGPTNEQSSGSTSAQEQAATNADAGYTDESHVAADVQGQAAGATAFTAQGSGTQAGTQTQTGEAEVINGGYEPPMPEIMEFTMKRPVWPSIVASLLATGGLYVLMSGGK